MDVARTSMIHAAAPHFLWPFAAFVRDLSADKLSPRAVPCVILGFPSDAPGWQFYHPTSRRVLSSQDITFDESVPYYRLFPYRIAPLPPSPLFLAPGPPPVDPLPPKGPAPSGVSQVDAVEPVKVALDSGATRGAEPVGAGCGGAESGGAEPGGAEPGGAEPKGAESGGVEPGGAEPGGAETAHVASLSASSRRKLLSPKELREWFARRWSRAAKAGGFPVAPGLRGARTCGTRAVWTGGGAAAAGVGAAGASGAAGAGATGAVGAGVGPARGTARAAGSTGATGPAGVGAVGAGGVAGTGGAGTGAATGGTGAVPVGTGGPARPRPYFVPLLEQVLGLSPSPSPAPPLECPLLVLADPASDSLRAASPTVTRLLLVAESASVCPPSVAGECALSTDVLENRQEEFQCFAAALPHLVSMLIAPEGDPDAPGIPTPRSYAEAIEGSYSSQWQSAMDAEMASWKSTGTYVDEVPPPGANIWHDTLRTTLAALGFAPSTADPSLFIRTDTSLPPFYILVYVDDLVFATADTAGLAHVKSELQKRHTCTDLGELRIYLGLQITRDRAQRTITLTQSHMVQQVLQRFDFTYSSPQATPLSTRHSHSALPLDESVEPSGPYPELVGCLMYLMTCTRPDLAYPLSILARYVAPGRHRPEHMAAAKRVLRYLCSTSGLGLVLGGRRPVVLTGHADASWADDQATQRSSQGYTFSLGSGSVSWRSTRSSSVLGSSCEAEIYAGAMAAQELRWLTYLLTDLGERPRSPLVLLEHRTKHIALRYFLARELQQRGQLRLAYVASEANTADIFTTALPPGDHQRFCTMLDCVQRGQLRLAYVASEANTADIFTKALPLGDHQRFCTMLGLVPTWPHFLTY
ncbi:unnamed protein product [Closterium sp. NIES-54]